MKFEVDEIRYELNEDGITVSVISKYFKKYEGEVVIPSSVEYNGNEYSVNAIGWNAFSGCSNLMNVIIPDSVTVICGGAFDGTHFYNNLPDGLVYFGKILYKYKGKMPNGTKVSIKEGIVCVSANAFSGCSGLTSVVIPGSVTVIGRWAFSGCSGLTSVVIPNSVTKIGKYAFDGCSGLTSVVIPDSVAEIVDETFKNCSGLASVVIPDSVTAIGEEAFSGCSGLEIIVIVKGNPIYDSRENCNAIIETKTNKLIIGCKNTIIPDSITEIGDYAFLGCIGLRSVVIPDSVTEIDDWAFCGCSGLTSVVIPDSVTVIGISAFEGCSGLTSVVIPDSITEIVDETFKNCSGLTSLVIPDSVTEIVNSAFYGCVGLESIIVGKGNQVYDSRENCNAIIETRANILIIGCKNTIISDSVTAIGDYAFSGCIGLTSVVLPDSVTMIDRDAFSGCSGLTSVVIPDSVTEIRGGTFAGCSGLTSVVIPDSVTKIGENAFYGCIGLTSVVIPDLVTAIGERAFDNTPFYTNQPDGMVYLGKALYKFKGEMPNGTKVRIKEGIVCVSPYAFKDCSGLASVVIPDSVTAIGDYAFSGCIGLTSVVLPDSVTMIDRDAFSGCSGLTSVVIPDSVTEIRGGTFAGCSGLTSVVIPDSVTEIGNSAFSGCSGLTSVVISDSVTEIDAYAFDGCIGLTSVVIPDSVTKIIYRAFRGCSGLTTLAYNAESCGLRESVVDGCDNLSTIVVGENVKSIPNELMKVESLNSVIVLAQELPKCEASISEKNNITVYVPKDAYVKYWLDEYWRNFNLCEFVPVESISLSEKDIYLNLDGKDTLQAAISPADATLKKVTWHSENLEVVTINQEGTIYGVSSGITYVTAEALDGSGVVARSRVFVGMLNSIELTPEELNLNIHGVSKIECSVLPESACNKAVEWSTTDDGVVAFRNNRDGSISVIGVSAGHAKILCKALDGGGACGVCEVVVENR